MKEKDLTEASRRLDAAGIPHLVIRDIVLLHAEDQGKAEYLLKDFDLNAEEKSRDRDMEEFQKAVGPVMEYMKRRKSQTHGLDGAIVIATYEGAVLKVDRMGIPASREYSQGQSMDISSSSLPETEADPERKEEHCEQTPERLP